MTTYSEKCLALASGVRAALLEEGIISPADECEIAFVEHGRKKRPDADFDRHWSPDTQSITVTIVRRETTSVGAEQTISPPSATEARMHRLVAALDRAERRPGFGFVALKWFRDQALPQEDFDGSHEAGVRSQMIESAIDRRWILTSKVPNPRPPHVATTAIRLNRASPEVAAMLGTGAQAPLQFQPVAIRGGDLSDTVLGDRR